MAQKKVLFVSDSVTVWTGFANQARKLAYHLHESGKYELAYLCWFYAPFNNIIPPFTIYTTLRDHGGCCKRPPCVMKIEPNKAPTYFRNDRGLLFPLPNDRKPCFGGGNIEMDKYAYQSLHAILLDYKPDIVWSLSDTWMHHHVNLMDVRRCYQYASWTPIDGAPMPHITEMGPIHINWVETLDKADVPVAFTSFGRDTMIATAKKYNTDLTKVKIIPHGCDTENYHPLTQEERQAAKKKLFNLEPDVFLIGFFSRNQPRKAIHKIFETLNLGKEKGYWNGQTLKCYLHCPIRDVGWNLPDLIRWHGLEDIVILNEKLAVGRGPSDQEMNEYYNACDITTLPSRGEGWGLCLSPYVSITYKDSKGAIKVKPIVEIERGEEVYTLDGTFNKVEDISTRSYTGKLYSIRPCKMLLPVECTEEEKFLVKRNNKIDWIKVEELNKTDYLVLPKIKLDVFNKTKKIDLQKLDSMLLFDEECIWYRTATSPKSGEIIKLPRYITIDEDFAWLCGMYIAEGSSSGHQIRFSLGSHEKELADRIDAIMIKICGRSTEKRFRTKESHTLELVYSSTLLVRLFRSWFGEDCYTKNIPFFLINQSQEIHGSLIKGMVSGDGCHGEKYGILYSTASRNLIQSLASILMYYDIVPTIQIKKYNDVHFQERIINRKTNYILQVYEINGYAKLIEIMGIKKILRDKRPKVSSVYSTDKENIYLKVRDITFKNVVDFSVYDLQVANNHSFNAEFMIVHNSISEAMSAGVPVLMSSYSAHHDWAKHAAARIKTKTLDSEPLTNIDRAIVDVEDYCEKIRAFKDNISIEEYIQKFGPIQDYEDEKKESA